MAEDDRPTTTQSLPLELPALERMIREDRIERGVHRFGAQQEVTLVDRSWSPAPGAHSLLERLADSHFTAELGPCNLELAPEPLILASDGLSRMESEISRLLEKLRLACHDLELHPVLTGILPTIRDESGSVEARAAGFRVHLQVGAEDFARLYDIAQVVAGPLMSVTANSPLLFGEPHWAESRIAPSGDQSNDRLGAGWVGTSILDAFDESQRWNRGRYGIIDGVPHLRIENRVMPSGPSVLDEIANAAYWLGLMTELGARYDDVTEHIQFERAQANFHAAAEAGIGSRLTWLDGVETSAQDLALSTLLPMAESGLRRRDVVEDDIARYLGVIEQRVRSMRTGARWLLSSLAGMKGKGTPAERLDALVAATVARQGTGRPVGEWERARLDETGRSREIERRVDHYMKNDLLTVQEDDTVDLVVDLMGRERVRHIPVEDGEHRLVGLVSYRAVLRHLMAATRSRKGNAARVADVMRTEIRTVTPETSAVDAIALMRRYRIGCLPVVSDGRLMGIVTEDDFMRLAADLLEQKRSLVGEDVAPSTDPEDRAK